MKLAKNERNKTKDKNNAPQRRFYEIMTNCLENAGKYC